MVSDVILHHNLCRWLPLIIGTKFRLIGLQFDFATNVSFEATKIFTIFQQTFVETLLVEIPTKTEEIAVDHVKRTRVSPTSEVGTQ